MILLEVALMPHATMGYRGVVIPCLRGCVCYCRGVGAWTEFNSSHCNVGFVCLCDLGSETESSSSNEADSKQATGNNLRIAVLEPHLDYDADLLTYKIPLKRTVSHVAYHPETGTDAYRVSASVPTCGEGCMVRGVVSGRGQRGRGRLVWRSTTCVLAMQGSAIAYRSDTRACANHLCERIAC